MIHIEFSSKLQEDMGEKETFCDRRNSEDSTGPNNTTTTQFNPTRHGSTADASLTALSGQATVSVSLEKGLSATVLAKSPVGRWVEGRPWKTFSQVFATMPGPLFRRRHGSVRVLMRTREILFATATGASLDTRWLLLMTNT